MDKTFQNIRVEYKFNENNDFSESNLSHDAIQQFEIWFNEALEVNATDANSMTLATCSKDCKPSARTVLLKDYDSNGFVFFTNYSSRKGKELIENPNAAILFFWRELGRQIRIEGTIEKVTTQESEDYFHSRPVDSQIAALASHQSSVISDRKALENKFDELKEMYKDRIIPLPEYWGGFRLIPETIEFWKGRQNRMHDRFRYTKKSGGWIIERLAP